MQVKMHTSTMIPFFQAIIDTESDVNMRTLFEDLIQLGRGHGGIEVATWLIQLHKDYAKGIESARKAVFNCVRAVEDFFHMKQRVVATLPSKLEHNAVEAEEASDDEGTECKAKTSKKKQKKIKKKYFGECIQLIDKTRFLPTLQLFDAIWRVIFHCARNVWHEGNTAKYLSDTYFQEVSVEAAKKVYKRIERGCWNCKSFLIAGHWYGILGTAPGTGTGSQTIEARHSDWEARVKRQTRSDPFTILPCMQELYNMWEDVFAWGAPVSFTTTAREWNGTLLNGASLAGLGRSTAAEFWRQRESGNHLRLARCTGAREEGESAMTYFYIMRAYKIDNVMPANAVIDRAKAELIVDAIVSEGDALEGTLRKMEVVVGESWGQDWQVDRSKLVHCFDQHCVVMAGSRDAPSMCSNVRTRETRTPKVSRATVSVGEVGSLYRGGGRQEDLTTGDRDN